MLDIDTSSGEEKIPFKEEAEEIYPVENSLSEQNKTEISVTSCELISDELEQPVPTIEDDSKTYEENSNIEDPNLTI